MTDKSICAHRRSERGYNLVELMVAILVIAISVLALYEMFIQGTRMINQEYNRQEGYVKATGHMERIFSYKFICDSIPRGLSGHFSELLVPEVEDVEPILADYIIEISHSDMKRQDGLPEYSHVQLKYSWTESSGRVQNIQLESWY